MLRIDGLTLKHKNNVLFTCEHIEMKQGEIVGILGLNGAGKTSLLKAILNFKKIEGVIELNQQPILKQLDKIAYISEEGSFIPSMTPFKYGKYLLDYYPQFDFEMYQSRCAEFKLEMNKKIERMSKGQQLKVEIAAGLSLHAKCILMDEPFTNLDVVSKTKALQMLIQSLSGDEVVLLATHDLEIVENVLDRCLILVNGKIADDFYVEKLHQLGVSLKDYFCQLTE